MSRKEKKYHFIYKTTDIRNNNYYIGMLSTNNLNDGYVGSGTRLRRLIYKHGKEIFKMEILEFLPDRKSLKEREVEIVNSDLLLEEKCMNLKPGGYGGFNNKTHQFKCSQAAGLKHSYRMKNDEEYRKKFTEKLSESGKRRHQQGELNTFKYDSTGKKHSPETKKLISDSKKGTGTGKLNSQFGAQWITNGDENKKIKKGGIIPNGWKLGKKSKIQGELIKNSKLKEKDVKLIKELLNDGKLSQRIISEQFNVRRETISKIKLGLIWKG